MALNQTAITFLGLDWDYGGFIQSWNGGKLEKFGGCSGLYMRLDSHSGPLLESLSGDRPINSDLPVLRDWDLRISDLRVVFSTPNCPH